MIYKFLQGGKQEEAIMLFVLGLAQTLLADPNQIIQISLQNPEALKAAIETFLQTLDMNLAAQAFQLAVLSLAVRAKKGAKLNYIKSLKHQCAEDEELLYFKRGGMVDCGCVKKQQKGGPVKKSSAVELFKANKEDTVHVNGKAYSLTDSLGKRLDKRFPEYTKALYQKDLKGKTKDLKNRARKQDLQTAYLKGGKTKFAKKGCTVKIG